MPTPPASRATPAGATRRRSPCWSARPGRAWPLAPPAPACPRPTAWASQRRSASTGWRRRSRTAPSIRPTCPSSSATRPSGRPTARRVLRLISTLAAAPSIRTPTSTSRGPRGASRSPVEGRGQWAPASGLLAEARFRVRGASNRSCRLDPRALGVVVQATVAAAQRRPPTGIRDRLETPRAGADVAHELGRVADDQAVIGHVAGHDRAGSDQGKAADRNAADDHGVRADGGAVVDAGLADTPVLEPFERPVGIDRAGVPVVRERGVRTDEHAVLERHAAVYGDVVLDLHAVADDDAVLHVDVASQDALVADHGVFADVR